MSILSIIKEKGKYPALVLAIAGIVFTAGVLAQAVLPSIKFEAEQGTLNQQAFIASDSLASNGAYIGFTTATTPPPSGAQFFETFETQSGFFDRFEQGFSVNDNDGAPSGVGTCRTDRSPAWQCIANLDPANLPDHAGHIEQWQGDHDMACGSPATQRTVDINNKNTLFWYCAPGNDPAKGHVMTSLHTSGYGIAWISPRNYLRDVRKVCWDMNLTDLAGGEWAQMIIATRADVERTNGDLGYSGPGFQDPTGPSTGIIPGPNTVGVKIFSGDAAVWRGSSFIASGTGALAAFRDRAARFQHCLSENPGGGLTLTQARPGGGTVTRTASGSLPDGDVRIVFQSDVYDSDKHNEDPTHEPINSANDPSTWHWDNITVE